MPSEKTAPEAPAPDPFEAELVAYLDGELEPAAARQVEARLAKDPAARARADELKKSFEMLDYLPRPDPSPNFTTRTLDKLPVLKPAALAGAGPQLAQSPEAARQHAPKPPPPAEPTPPGDDELLELRPAHPRRFLWAAGVVAAVSAFAAVGYLTGSLVRPHVVASRDKDDDQKIEVEPRVVEHLPLYAVADDIGFVAELTKPEYFGEDPAVAFDAGLKIPAADVADKPTGKEFDALARAFRALPPARRAEIVRLDRDLFAKEPRERDRLVRALEAYAVWLERLPEPERRAVQAQDTAALRLGLVRKVRDQQWWDALPPVVRAKPELIPQWREEEAARRDRWLFVRQHAEAFAANRSPWPFDTETGRTGVLEFARIALKPDDAKGCRLTPDQLAEYKRLHAAAEKDGAWAWYGLFVYEMSKAHAYLPDSDNSKLMLTEPNELPEHYARVFKKGSMLKIKPGVTGKWPEFPLEVARETGFMKLFGPPGSAPAPLGPARLSDFKEPVRTFATKELFPKMSAEERSILERLQGRWPDYPQRFMQYAHKYDLAVPGVTLPGPPKDWDATYGTRAAPRPNN